MYEDKYVFRFKTFEVIRIGNQARLAQAIFHQHNDNGQRFLRKDLEAVTGILKEAADFVNANIGHVEGGVPTVYKKWARNENESLVPFRPDATTVYRIWRALGSLEHIYSQLTQAEQQTVVQVTVRNTSSGDEVQTQLSVAEMRGKVRSVLLALMDNLKFWDAQNGSTV